jgi:hypothetical protein
MFVTGDVGATYDGYSNLTGARAAEVCILMLGTNDIAVSRSAAAVRANIASIAATIMRNNDTIVCLSTIPPHPLGNSLAQQYNARIRDIAQSGLVIDGVNGGNPVYFPLIDYYQAIVYRRPSDYNGTLMEWDGAHPSSVDSAGDPYADGGALLSDDGYLLRCWLSFQKLKEIKEYCIDGNLPPPPPPDEPVANAGPDQVDVRGGSSVQLDGSGSANAVQFSWAFASDSDAAPALVPAADVPAPSFTAGAPGTSYHLELVVTDGVSQADTDDMWIWVDPAYAIADIVGSTAVAPGATVVLSASTSWTYGDAAAYAWSVDPLPEDPSALDTDTISFTAGTIGESYDVVLIVDDTQGHTDEAAVLVTVVDFEAGRSSGTSCTPGSGMAPAVPVALMLIAVAARTGRARRD